MKNILIALAVVILSCNTPAPAPEQQTNTTTTDTNTEAALPAPTPRPDTLCIVGVGDIMPGSAYPSANYLPANDDCAALFSQVNELLQNADLTFGNLEGCYIDSGTPAKQCDNPALCFAFRSPVRYFSCIEKAGFDLLSLANNHSCDFGEAGTKSTINLLQKTEIGYAGLLSCPTAIVERNGIRYGFCAFSPIEGTCRVEEEFAADAQRLVSELRPKVDVLIVSMHAGAEGNGHEHVTRTTEVFYNEDRGNVYTFAHRMIDAGADIIFGHGPHVTRAVEVYKNRLIAYSLGNFCTYGRFNLKAASGIAPLLKVYTTTNGQFIRAEVVSTYQTKTQGPQIDTENRAFAKIKQLSMADFPEQKLLFTANGFTNDTLNAH